MPQVVILPGLDGTGRLLGKFCGCLGELGIDARAIEYPPDRGFTYDELKELACAQLPASTSFVLLGESFSGPLAIRIAAEPPSGLLGLVLSTTFARAPVPAMVPLASLAHVAPARPPMLLLSWFLLGAWATPALRSQLAETLRLVSPAVLRARAVAALRADVTELLPSIQLPVLQLVAGQDRLLSRAASADLTAGLQGCVTTTIPGPHLLLQTATEPAAKEVAEFVLRLGPNNGFNRTPESSGAAKPGKLSGGAG